MARTVKNGWLDTRAARAKLTFRREPYWQKLSEGCYVGYRRLTQFGTWIARMRDAATGRQHYQALGPADDIMDAEPGVRVLSFSEAQALGRQFFKQKGLELSGQGADPSSTITVRTAVEEYIAARENRDAKERGDELGLRRGARSVLTKHVLSDPTLAAKLLGTLSKDDLSKRRNGLQMADASVQRVTSDFKAALNTAARKYGASLPANIRDIIKDGLRAEFAVIPAVREAQVLSDAEVRRVIAAARKVDAAGEWEGSLHRMVLKLAATGARFSQSARMKVADVQAEQGRVMVPVSRNGRGVKASTHIAFRVGDDVLAELAKVTAGRRGSERLFLRPHWKQISPTKWEKVGYGPWLSASELTRPWD